MKDFRLKKTNWGHYLYIYTLFYTYAIYTLIARTLQKKLDQLILQTLQTLPLSYAVAISAVIQDCVISWRQHDYYGRQRDIWT